MSFLTRPTTLKLEFVWLVKFNPRAHSILAQDSLDSLYYLGHNFWLAGPIAAKLDSLETRHPELSNKPKIIKFGLVLREICLLEVGLAADVNAFNSQNMHACIFTPKAGCCIPLCSSYVLPFFQGWDVSVQVGKWLPKLMVLFHSSIIKLDTWFT